MKADEQTYVETEQVMVHLQFPHWLPLEFLQAKYTYADVTTNSWKGGSYVSGAHLPPK
jgi:hypothetical protein